ncbi:MAG: MATE family efflux transporter [Lachnospiraceae bacterium]|nr:MATE family efflux transporter [Lachnospiraceae bacterium]
MLDQSRENHVHGGKPTTLLTEGSIWKKIIGFAIPIFLGNLFQQLYNTADSLIVGNYIGSDALAAVSSSGNLIFLMVGFFSGIAMGAGVVIARYYGARRKEEVSRAVHTMVAFGLAAGVILTLLGVLVTPQILRWMGTPKSVFPNSVLYFRIYFAGSLGFVMYNVFVGILQSVGDSRHPLIYLIISSVTNVGLDLLFIAVLGMGVGAAALATTISQFASALLCLRRLIKTEEEYRIEIKKICFDRVMMHQIITNGLPAGVQNSIIALANVVVQSNVNAFGMTAMAGCGAYSKIEGFGFLPITCFAMSLTTFISQNLGAKKYERVKKGARFGILCSIITAEIVGICIYLFIPNLIRAFDSNPEVIRYGTTQARTVTLFYFLLALSHCLAGIFRGAGKSIVPMVVMLLCWCVIRITYITAAVRIVPVIRTVFWAYPLTWSLSSIIFAAYFLKADWMHNFERQEEKSV